MLLAGLGGLGAEVAKNLILAGVKGLTLLDHEQVPILTKYTQRNVFFSPSSSKVTVAYRVELGFSLNLEFFVYRLHMWDICKLPLCTVSVLNVH